jgi:hypothetical protein
MAGLRLKSPVRRPRLRLTKPKRPRSSKTTSDININSLNPLSTVCVSFWIRGNPVSHVGDQIRVDECGMQATSSREELTTDSGTIY